jgi:hypothetical protein
MVVVAKRQKVLLPGLLQLSTTNSPKKKDPKILLQESLASIITHNKLITTPIVEFETTHNFPILVQNLKKKRWMKDLRKR